MTKVACLYANGTEEVELLAVVDVLRRGGVQADLISIHGPEPVSAHEVVIKPDALIDDTDFKTYDAIYIPGGSKGAEAMAQDPTVQAAIKEFNAEARTLAAICAGPTVLEAAGVLKGHKGTSYSGFGEELSLAEYSEDLVVQSDHILTSRGPGTALLFGLALLTHLGEADKAKELQEAMLIQGDITNIK